MNVNNNVKNHIKQSDNKGLWKKTLTNHILEKMKDSPTTQRLTMSSNFLKDLNFNEIKSQTDSEIVSIKNIDYCGESERNSLQFDMKKEMAYMLNILVIDLKDIQMKLNQEYSTMVSKIREDFDSLLRVVQSLQLEQQQIKEKLCLQVKQLKTQSQQLKQKLAEISEENDILKMKLLQKNDFGIQGSKQNIQSKGKNLERKKKNNSKIIHEKRFSRTSTFFREPNRFQSIEISAKKQKMRNNFKPMETQGTPRSNFDHNFNAQLQPLKKEKIMANFKVQRDTFLKKINKLEKSKSDFRNLR